MIECDNNEEFIIANLSSSVFNETLDLAFNEGEKICFKVDGPGTVHLTGNLMDEDNLSPSGEDFSMLAGSDSEMESEEEAGEKIQEVIEKSGKRKKVEEVKNQEVVAKKAKVDAEEESEESEDGDDDDESGEDETTDADTTANATTGDDDDDSDDSDEDDSEEEDESGEDE